MFIPKKNNKKVIVLEPKNLEEPIFSTNEVSDIPIIEEKNIEHIKNLSSIDKEHENNKNIEKEKLEMVDLNILKNMPLAFVFKNFKAIQLENKDEWEYNGFKYKCDGQKWFNFDIKRGNVGAIALTKQLLAIKEDVNEYDNDKILFKEAIKLLKPLQETIDNIQINHVKEQIKEIKESTEVIKKEVVDNSEKNSENKNIEEVIKTNKKKLREVLEQFKDISPIEIMEMLGANANEDGQRGKWKMPGTGANIHVTKNMWKDWNGAGGGHGGLSLLKYHLSEVNSLNMKREDDRNTVNLLSAEMLIETFGLDVEFEKDESVIYKDLFYAPTVIEDSLNEVRKYLIEKRGIQPWIVEKQIKSGLLYAGYPKEWEKENKKIDFSDNDNIWAVFLGINANSAEMRAIQRTDQFAKIMAKGSVKESGGFVIKAEDDKNKEYAIFEASVDSLSYHALNPNITTMSSIGVNFQLAKTLAIEVLSKGGVFNLCFDNDAAGNEGVFNFLKVFKEDLDGTDQEIEEAVKELINNNDIKLFELARRVLKETLAENKIFYFDVKDNEQGLFLAKLFREQVLKSMNKEDLWKSEKLGNIKYINLEPNFFMLKEGEIELEAKYIVDKLNKQGKTYYLRIKQDNDDKDDIKFKKEKLLNEIKKYAKENYQKLIDNGVLILQKDNLAKDWNEYYLLMKQKPEFQEYLKNQQDNYINKYNKKSKLKFGINNKI